MQHLQLLMTIPKKLTADNAKNTLDSKKLTTDNAKNTPDSQKN